MAKLDKETMNNVLSDIEEQFNNLTEEQYNDYCYDCGLMIIVDKALSKYNVKANDFDDEDSEIIDAKFRTCMKQYNLLHHID